MFRRFATVMVALSFSFAGGWAQQNPFVGTWKLIPSKSTINDIPRVSQILTLEAYGKESFSIKRNSVIVVIAVSGSCIELGFVFPIYSNSIK